MAKGSGLFCNGRVTAGLGAALVWVSLAVPAAAADPEAQPPQAPAAAQPAAPAAAAEPAMSPGEYLATAGNCVSCHTRPGGAPFSGGVAFHTPFGTIYSTNITPHATAGIGSWTEEEFRRAMHEGLDKDGQPLYPAFPYPAFTLVTDEDVKSIYDYLKTVPASDYQPPANDMPFPFSQRALMKVWNGMFFTAGRYTPDSSQSAEWNRGKYLVDGLGHCGTCHNPRNFLGGEQTDLAMTGGTYNDHVKPDTIRKWSSVNLTQAPTGLAKWSAEDIARYMKTGHNNWVGTFGPMNEVIMASTSKLSDADIQAMAAYIKSLPPLDTTDSQTLSAEEARAGELVYTVHCGTCHLPTGLGDKSTGPPVVGSPVVQAPDPAALINVILYGATVPSPSPPGAWGNMKGFYMELSDDEVASLANFLRGGHFGNKGGKVSADDVAAQR